MNQPSRQMPKFKQRPIKPLNFIASMIILMGLFGGLVYFIWKVPLFSIVIILIVIVSIRENWQETKRLKNLAQQRTGESICHFARSFDYRRVDTWVIRAVYEQIQNYVGLNFPVKASDRLVEDLGVDPEELDMALAVEIAERTGRNLITTENNPYYNKVETVQDLVLFFNAQQKD